MNLRSVYFLFALLLAVLVAFVVVQWRGPSDPYTGDMLAPGLRNVKASDVDKIELTHYHEGQDKKEEIVFVRKDGGWQMEKPYPLRAQTFAVDDIVSQLARAKREKADLTHNLSELGLKPAPVTVTVHKGDQSWTVMLTRPSSEKGGDRATVYGVSAERPTEPMVFRANDLDALFKKSYHDYRERALITASTWDAKGIALADGKGKELAFAKADDGSWRFTKPAYGPADYEGETATPPPALPGMPPPPTPAKTSPGVKDLIDAVSGLRVEGDNDFVAEGVSEADLTAKYGLAADKPGTLRIEIAATKTVIDDKKDDKDKEKKEDKKKDTADVLLVGKRVSGKDSERPDAKKPPEKKDDKKDEKKDGKPEEKKDEKKEDKTEYYYVRVAGEGAVARVPAAKLDKVFELFNAPDKLRDRNLLPGGAAKATRIDAVDLKNSNGLLKLRKGGDATPFGGTTWKLWRDGAAATTEPGIVDRLVDKLAKQRAVDFPADKEETLEFDKPAAVVTVYVDSIAKEEKKEEKKDDPQNKDAKKEDKKDEKKDDKKDEKEKEPKLKEGKPAVTLTFGKRDRDKKLVYVRRESGDDKSILRVEEALFDDVSGSALSFLERKLPTFAEFEFTKEVSKVVLTRGKETFEIVKEKVGDKFVWKFAAPEALKGKSANEQTMTEAVTDLGRLRPDRLVAEKATDADLDTLYGLKTPAFKATLTVTKGDKAEEWVYLFGKATDGDKSLFAKQGKGDLVFAVPRASVEPVLTGDLRDKAVFAFDIAKVKTLRLTGWKDVFGTPHTLELERKGDKKWEAKAPAGFTADESAVEAFAVSLATLKADRFVTPKADAKPNLDPNLGGLKVEVTVDGQEKPLEIVIGAEDPENKNFFFAKSSTQSEPFLVPKFAFDKAKEKTAHFAKK